MSNSIEKTFDVGDISMTSAAVGSKIGDKAEDTDDSKPLLLGNNNSEKINLNIWNAPIISGFISFKQILGPNFAKAIYVLLILTLCFTLAQVSAYLLDLLLKSSVCTCKQQDFNVVAGCNLIKYANRSTLGSW